MHSGFCSPALSFFLLFFRERRERGTDEGVSWLFNGDVRVCVVCMGRHVRMTVFSREFERIFGALVKGIMVKRKPFGIEFLKFTAVWGIGSCFEEIKFLI